MVGPRGNCFSACIAMLLDYAVDDVPNYSHLGGAEQDAKTDRWLRDRGYQLLGPYLPDSLAELDTRIACGPSPREPGVAHAVIVGGGWLFDPHPSDAGLPSVDCFYLIARVGTPLETAP